METSYTIPRRLQKDHGGRDTNSGIHRWKPEGITASSPEATEGKSRLRRSCKPAPTHTILQFYHKSAAADDNSVRLISYFCRESVFSTVFKLGFQAAVIGEDLIPGREFVAFRLCFPVARHFS